MEVVEWEIEDGGQEFGVPRGPDPRLGLPALPWTPEWTYRSLKEDQKTPEPGERELDSSTGGGRGGGGGEGTHVGRLHFYSHDEQPSLDTLDCSGPQGPESIISLGVTGVRCPEHRLYHLREDTRVHDPRTTYPTVPRSSSVIPVSAPRVTRLYGSRTVNPILERHRIPRN